MSIFSRYFGRKDADDLGGGRLVAKPGIERMLSLQVLFSDAHWLDTDRLIGSLRSYHRSMSEAQCEFASHLIQEGTVMGMVEWDKHAIGLVGFDMPYPAAAFDRCVAASHYPQELKQHARSHKAHVILYYVGQESSPLEQFVALAATAGALARLGAIVVLNESGHTSFPAAALSGLDSESDIMELLRGLPLPILYCGFVKLKVEGVPGVWMRTYGAPLLGLPDLAGHATGDEEGQRYFNMFDSIFRYLRESNAQLAAGDTSQIDEEEYLRFRAPNEEEQFLQGGAELLVVETITPDEINPLKR